MAIRIRWINEKVIAVCAAKTSPQKDDLYIDDSAHHALTTKFSVDWVSEGIIEIEKDLADERVKELMLNEERNQ